MTAIHLGSRFPGTSSGLPGSRMADRTSPRRAPAARDFSLLGLAPGGVYLARLVTQPAGALLPHRFTLTSIAEANEAVCFLWHYPWPCGRWALPTTVSSGARTFLSPTWGRATVLPAPDHYLSYHVTHAGDQISQQQAAVQCGELGDFPGRPCDGTTDRHARLEMGGRRSGRSGGSVELLSS